MIRSNLIDSLKSLFVERSLKPRRRTSRLYAEGVMQLEARRMLSADVTAQLVGGSFFLTGSTAGSRTLLISQDTTNPALLDVQPGANTTVNGSANLFQIPAANITHDFTVNLNNGAGVANTSTVEFDTGTFNLSGNLFVNLIGAGSDSVKFDSGKAVGSVSITTGGGDDDIDVNHIQVQGNLKIDSGTGNDAVRIADSTLMGTSVTESGLSNKLTVFDSSLASLKAIEKGSESINSLDTLTIGGSLSITQSAGKQVLDLVNSTVNGAVSISEGNTPQHSSLMIASDKLGSLTIDCGNGGYAIQTNDLEIHGAFKITVGNGNTDVGIFGTNKVSGQTSISIGKGNSAVAIVGFPGFVNPLPPISTFAGITIKLGKGQSGIALNNLNGSSLNIISPRGTFLAIGGQRQIPAIPGDLYSLSGTPLFGGAVKFSGRVRF